MISLNDVLNDNAQRCSSDKNPSAVRGSPPATLVTAVPTKDQNGSAIALRTHRDHTRRLRRPRTPASRREAAVTTTAESENNYKAPHCSEKQVPKLLGVTRKLPWHGRGLEEDGAAPATVKVAGAEEDEAETTA